MRRRRHCGEHPLTPGLVALVAALGLIFTACGGGGGSKKEGGESTGGTTGGTSSTAYDINPVARAR